MAGWPPTWIWSHFSSLKATGFSSRCDLNRSLMVAIPPSSVLRYSALRPSILHTMAEVEAKAHHANGLHRCCSSLVQQLRAGALMGQAVFSLPVLQCSSVSLSPADGP